MSTVYDAGVKKEQGVGGLCKDSREQIGCLGTEECGAFCWQKLQRNGWVPVLGVPGLHHFWLNWNN